MEKWKGTMEADSFVAKVVVFHKKDSEIEDGIWYGHGSTTTFFEGVGHLKTNIGDIMIRLTNQDSRGSNFDFVGRGKPKLA